MSESSKIDTKINLNQLSKSTTIKIPASNDFKDSITVFSVENTDPPYTTMKKRYGYKNALLGKLRMQRETDASMCDMVICVDDHKFPVHKCIMIASCDYFDAMVRSGMQETQSNLIYLKGKWFNNLNHLICGSVQILSTKTLKPQKL